MNKNTLYLIIGVLAIAVVALGFYVWQKESRPEGVEIRLDQNGISVERN